MRFKSTLLTPLCAACLAGVPADAVQTHFIEEQGFQTFRKGELENFSLSHSGELRLAPALRELAVLDDAVIWSAVADKDGNLILGTGNEGRVLRLDRDNQVSVLFEPDAVLTRALALDADGNIYVGTSPDGAIYRLRAEGGKPELFHDPAAAYLWDFVLSDDALFVATGAPATLLRIPLDEGSDGAVETWLETEDDHLTTLFQREDGSFLVGSSGRGIVYAVKDAETARAILAAEEPEIRAIGVDAAGRPVIAAYSSTARPEPEPSAQEPEDANELPPFVVTASAVPGAAGGQMAGAASARSKGSGRLYVVQDGGVVMPLWRSRDAGIYSMLPLDETSWLLGLNSDGRTLILEDRYNYHWLQNTERGGAVSHLLRDPLDPSSILVLTSNPAAVYRLGGQNDVDSVYTSAVADARQSATWSSLEVVPEGVFPLKAEVRAGNTPTPDKLWTDWAEVVLEESGGALRGQIDAPQTRYLQYRLRVPGDTERAVLHRVRAFYELANAEPSIVRFEVLPFGADLSEASMGSNQMLDFKQAFSPKAVEQFMSGNMPRYQLQRLAEDGQWTIVWWAVDPNNDELRYSVYLRRADGGDWQILHKDLEMPMARISTRGLRDGYIRLRVDASDAPSNPQDQALTATRVSDLIIVDNAPPQIEETEGDGGDGVVVLRASDSLSRIYAAYLSRNGGDFEALRPQDGIYDAATESFVINAEEGEALRVEVYDEAGNSAVWAGE